MRIPVPVLPECADDEIDCWSDIHVAAGAAWLDKIKPGWERLMDTGTLDISSPYTCVCAQVVPLGKIVDNGYVDVANFLIKKFPNVLVPEEHLGFCAAVDQDAWIELLKTRYDHGTLSDMKTIR